MAENFENFESLLNSLHANAALTDSAEIDNYVEINSKRQFVISPNFNTIIAYEGDINSQIITFKSVRYSDGHDLYACQNHEIRWKNLASGIEGTSKLLVTEADIEDNIFYAKWEVPSELCTSAGSIEISIAYYDRLKLKIDTDIQTGPVVYSWNTSSYTGLSIGKSMDSVGFQFPAKNEILSINKETRIIVAPVGYNNIVCNYGDIGVSTLYFLIDRYIGGKNKIDIFNDNTKIAIYVTLNGKKIIVYSDDQHGNYLGPIHKTLYTGEIPNRSQEGMVLITWPVPEKVTRNDDVYSGTFEIAIEFFTDELAWYSSSYNLLQIGKGASTVSVDDDQDIDVTIEMIYSIIESFFDSHDVTIDNN